MLYVKNVPSWERILRVLMGLLGLGYAWGGDGLAVSVGLTGATLAVSGLVGFCPLCALAGRKLDKGQ
jgi:hypothetical protein